MVSTKNNINKFKEQIKERAERVVDKETRKLFNESTKSGMTPVATGKTKDQTKMKVKAGATNVTGMVGIGTDYAKYPYYGTTKMKAGGKTGTAKWTETAAKKQKIKDAIRNGMKGGR